MTTGDYLQDSLELGEDGDLPLAVAAAAPGGGVPVQQGAQPRLQLSRQCSPNLITGEMFVL